MNWSLEQSVCSERTIFLLLKGCFLDLIQKEYFLNTFGHTRSKCYPELRDKLQRQSLLPSLHPNSHFTRGGGTLVLQH